MQPLKVSDNRRFLVHADGAPFFYLADTAWELFHRLDLPESEYYLRDRASKGFTAIQAVLLAELDGLSTPNRDGEVPLADNDPTRPNDAYFRHVDQVVDLAASLGLWMAMLPTWGDKWNDGWTGGPVIFNPSNAAVYGEYLGRRYRDKPIIWIMGGDRGIDNDQQAEIIRAMANGIKRGNHSRHLMTFHPPRTSSKWFHDDDWLDFNMAQVAHTRDAQPYEVIAGDYARQPAKPCLNGEPSYEDHPDKHKIDPVELYLDDKDARNGFYWSVFAGAMGHTYGCHDVWQMWTGDRKPVNAARIPWQEAIHLPGAAQMQLGRRLVESRPYLTRVPDQSLLAESPDTPGDHAQACRDAEGRYAFIYIPTGLPTTIDLTAFRGKKLHACWFDPRIGRSMDAGGVASKDIHTFTPPSRGRWDDWILVLDDVAANYPTPNFDIPRT